ncbi:MAG: NADH-quinone oxidoreductase subunit NuoE [Planctomycetota bacterium]
MIGLKEAEKTVDKLADKNGKLLISFLEEVQGYYNYLPEEALRAVAKKTRIPLRDVYGVATFYNAFRMKPCGKHLICVCLGTACHVRGGARIKDKVERTLNIKAGETTKDKKFTLETVNCLGACALGPVMVVDGKYHGNMAAAKVDTVLKDSQSKKRNKK